MRVALLMLMICIAPCSVAETNVKPDGRAGNGGLSGVAEWFTGAKPGPAESEFSLPKVVTLGNWATFSIPQLKATNSYALSLDSVVIGDDNIVRYAVAVKPLSGNVTTLVFEGIDCKSNQYRRYASATTSEWRLQSTKEWKPAIKNGHNAWQGFLADDFCRLDSPYSIESIKKNFGTQVIPNQCPECTPVSKN